MRVVCAACPSPAECEVWGIQVCRPCASDWAAHSPTHGQIFGKYGPEADTVKIYQEFTERWLKARKERAA